MKAIQGAVSGKEGYCVTQVVVSGDHLHLRGYESEDMISDNDVELECPFCCQVLTVRHYHSVGDLIYHKGCENHSVLIKATNPPPAGSPYVLIKERRAHKR